MDYTEHLLRQWTRQDGLTPLTIKADFDRTGEPLRMWWIFSDTDLISDGGLCDDEVIAFLSDRHELTFTDRLLIDQATSADMSR